MGLHIIHPVHTRILCAALHVIARQLIGLARPLGIVIAIIHRCGGNRYHKGLRIGDLTFAADEMEIQVSAISADALTKAQHTDELVRDGNTHLRIDYKVSGLGSNSCGPDLEKVYRLEEKQISFRYEIYPTEQ